MKSQLTSLRIIKSRRIAAQAICAVIVLLCVAAGSYPEPLFSRADIRAAKPTLEEIEISKLPLEDYPFLSKFTRVKKLRLYMVEGSSVTDEHLKALAKLNFTNLFYIDLNNCRLVTDRGIEALAAIPTLKQLPLERTAITDKSCEFIASKMALTMVLVAHCDRVTKAGLQALAKSQTLTSVRFSADKSSQEEILALLDSFKNLQWCEIVDPQRTLDATTLKAKGEQRKIHVTIMPMGARYKPAEKSK
jgi:hypothetical protein